MMKEQMALHCNEQAYNDASEETKDHRRLPQTDRISLKINLFIVGSGHLISVLYLYEVHTLSIRF